MRSDIYNPMKSYGLRGLSARQIWARFAVVMGLTALYILTFQFVAIKVGLVAAALVALPVAVTGLYFGINAGLIGSLVGIGISLPLLIRYGGQDWIYWLAITWPGDLLVIAAGYAGGLVKNSLSDRIRIEVDLRSRERFLSLINLTTKSILDPKKDEDVYYRLITHLANLFVADYAYLVRWDEVREQAVLVAATKSMERNFSTVALGSDEATLIKDVLSNRNVLIINDVPDSHYVVNPGPFKELPVSTQSAFVIPLIAGEYKFGAVILNFDLPHHFGHDELTYAELAGNQIALALWTSQQDLKIKKQLKEAITLASIERALSETERVGLETVLQLIIDSARELIPEAQYAVLHLLNEEEQLLVPSAVAGIKTRSKTKLNMRLGEGVAGQVIATRTVISVPDTQSDARFLNQTAPVNFRSLIVAPIQSNERCVGTISIQSEQPNVFTTDDGQLLGALGTEAAIAIENSKLLETTQHDLKEINALYHMSQGLVASLDPDQLMKDVVDFLHDNFGYYHVQIFTLDPETGNMIARQGSGKIGARLRKQKYYLPVGAGIVGHTAETCKPFVTNNVDDVVFFIRDPLLPDTQSEMTVPIKVEDQVLGVLDIQQTPPGRLTQREMQLMIAVADQLAVALQKANLYSELQVSLNQEKAIRSRLIQSERLAVVGRLLASVSHELNNPLQAIQNALFLLKDEEKLSAQGRQDMDIILAETERMTVMIERLRAAYRPTRVEDFQDIFLNDMIDDVHALTATQMRHNNIAFEFLPDPALSVVFGTPDQIRQVILNLFVNAIEAMRSGGKLSVYTRELPEQGKILLSFGDTGPGIDAEILPHIFEPFITNKETGTGLGLSISYDIIRQHNGEIQAENNPTGGAVFKVWLPIKREN
jgi:signal transduction histidine kinase